MRNVTSALWLTLAAALFAGCSANSQIPQASTIPAERTQAHEQIPGAASNVTPQGTPVPAPPTEPRPPGWLSPEVQGGQYEPLFYAVDKTDSKVLIYAQSSTSPRQIGMITSGVSNPWGLYVDKNGTLYVANQTGSVTVYPAGSLYPSATYTQNLDRPLYPIVDQYGDLFVGNAGTSGTVVEYLAGSTSTYRVLQTPGTEVDGMDFDQQGNLYVAYRNGFTGGSVEEFAPGSTQGQILGMTIRQPQGLIVDAEGNIDVSLSASQAVVQFRPGAKLRDGGVRLPAGSGNSSELALTATQDEAYISSEGGDVYLTSYPGRLTSIWAVRDEGLRSLEGIALNNGQTF